MSQVFVILNQHGHYLGKQKQWLDGRDRRLLFRSPHRDEVVNLVFELSNKDIDLRAEILGCEIDHQQQPLVEAGPPLPDPESAVADGDDCATQAAAQESNLEDSLEPDNSLEHDNSLEQEDSPERNSLERDNSPELDSSPERNNSHEPEHSAEAEKRPERGLADLARDTNARLENSRYGS